LTGIKLLSSLGEAGADSVRQVLQTAVIGWLGLGGLSEVKFFVLPEIVHIEVAVGFEPVFVCFDG
jgi:hypothetical protein